MRAKSRDRFSENSGGPCRVSGVRQCLARAGTPGPRPGRGGGGGGGRLERRARPRGPQKQVTRRPAGGPRGGLQGRGGACQRARPPPARAGGAAGAASGAAAGSRAPPGAARELGAPAAAARCGAPGKPPGRAGSPGQTRGPPHPEKRGRSPTCPAELCAVRLRGSPSGPTQSSRIMVPAFSVPWTCAAVGAAPGAATTIWGPGGTVAPGERGRREAAPPWSSGHRHSPGPATSPAPRSPCGARPAEGRGRRRRKPAPRSRPRSTINHWARARRAPLHIPGPAGCRRRASWARSASPRRASGPAAGTPGCLPHARSPCQSAPKWRGFRGGPPAGARWPPIPAPRVGLRSGRPRRDRGGRGSGPRRRRGAHRARGCGLPEEPAPRTGERCVAGGGRGGR